MIVADTSEPEEESVTLDDATVSELQEALSEADAGDFVSEEEVWSKIEARYGK